MCPLFERIDVHDSNHVKNLEKMLLNHLPESIQMIVMLRIASQQTFPSEKIDIKFYLFREDQDEEEDLEGTVPFLVCIQSPNFHTQKGIIILSPENPTEAMVRTLDSLINWEEAQIFQCIQQPMWEPIWKLSRSHGKLVPANNQGFPMIVHAITDIKKAQDLDISIDDNMEVRELTQDDVPKVVETWASAKPHSKEAIGYCVGSLLSCGLFQDGEMISSVLLSPLGSFNVLYTSEKFRKRGLGQLVMKWISREGARQIGTFPLAEVEAFNEASKTVLQKIGYEVMYHTRWFIYEPK